MGDEGQKLREINNRLEKLMQDIQYCSKWLEHTASAGQELADEVRRLRETISRGELHGP